MARFGFTFMLDRFVEDLDEIDALYDQCKDASLETVGKMTFVHFDREGDTLDGALRSAASEVQSFGYVIKRIEVEPASVGVS